MIDRSVRDRYLRQIIFPNIGDKGQARLLKSRVVIIGCGALGCTIANLLVRAGIGSITIIDRDFIEYQNLQRQILFTEADVKSGLPKAIAAERYLRKVNSTIDIKGIVVDVNSANIAAICGGTDIILDGADNFETRLLINDFALKNKIPWVYGGVVGAHGMTMNIIPDETPCFRCIHTITASMEKPLTCESAGVVNSVPTIIGAVQVAEAIKILLGAPEINRDLMVADVWTGNFDRIKAHRLTDCPACNGKYEYLNQQRGLKITSLRGQNRSIQIVNTARSRLPLNKLAARLTDVNNLFRNRYFLRFDAEGCRFTVFPDGRVVIKNTLDEAQAKLLYEKYLSKLLPEIKLINE